jgi:DNA polymerase-3 subunit gamma/tau
MDRVAHGFLFAGVRGVGKTSLARILARALNCEKGPTVDPCGECASCRAITAGTAVDVIEIDGASNNSVDDIRELRETVPYRPALGRYKIYVIDEVHMLSVSAFNALLKTLEEPPPHVKFIFATTEPHKIPTTILSRCQRYDFRRIPTSAIVDRIRRILDDEGIRADDAALAIIGREAEGSMRDALSILDQVLAAGAEAVTGDAVADLLGVVSRKVYYDLSAAMLAQSPRRCMEIVREVNRQGYDVTTFARGLLEHMRNLVVAGVCGDDPSLLDLPDEEISEVLAQAGSTSRDTLHRMFKHFSEAYEEIARSSHPRVLFEAALARIADMGELLPADELIRRLEAISAGRTPPPPRSGPAPQPRPPASAPPRSGQPSAPPEPPPPATEGAPEASAAAPEPGRSIASLGDWKKLLDDFAQVHPAKSSIVERSIPAAGDGDGVLVLRFDAHDRFAAERAGDAAFRRELEAFLGSRAGRRVRVEVELRDLGDESTLAQARLEKQERHRRREEEAREHPVVRGAVTAFGGTISRISLSEGTDKKKS